MNDLTDCYRDRNNGVYFTRNSHQLDCRADDCKGCRPCPAAHHCNATRNCSWHVAEGEETCGRCLGRVRRDLRWIDALASLLMPAALSDGVDSAAAILAGPAADPEAWSWRKVTARNGGTWHISLVEDDDEHHPLTVVGTWERMIREDYGHEPPRYAPATVSGAVAYLDRQLYRVANDPEQDFNLLAREVRKCRQHLEAVLHNDHRPERGLPCPSCVEAGEGAPRLVRVYAQSATDDRFDEWHCPRNRAHVWSHRAYEAYLLERRGTRTGTDG